MLDKTEIFIQKSQCIHGDHYDYSRVTYQHSKVPVEVICREHGLIFLIRPNDHLSGKGCRICGQNKSITERTKTKEDFIKDAIVVHGDRYDYSRVEYVNALTKVEIGYDGDWFWQTPANHLTGHGSVKERNTKFRETHYKGGTVYDKMVKTNHLKYGVDIPTQSPEIYKKLRKTAQEKYGVQHPSQSHIAPETIEKLNSLEYMTGLLSKMDARAAGVLLNVDDTTVCRYARIHNIHDGYRSNLERSLGEWIRSLPFEFRTDRTVLAGKEIDNYCKEKKFGVELGGLYPHTEITGKKNEHYHYDKLQKCIAQNIVLITPFEDEWYDRQLIVKNIILNQLGLQTVACGARHIEVKQIDNKTANRFFEKYHLQKTTTLSVNFGGFVNGILVGAMGFGSPVRKSKHPVELKRFCTNGNIYPGLASKLFKSYLKIHTPTSIVSFCDRRFFQGNLYLTLGFVQEAFLRPDYSYTNNYRTRRNKSNFRLERTRKWIDDPGDKTEWEIMQILGYDRIWDCGKIRYVWTRATVNIPTASC